MMDDNDLCPLCCEELDMSDRQFFPCKCGYQVCMWCWHRIRESESGLCPACRTPYGDDPHEFSAVDMQEVVKANKEKAAAEKRERERLKFQQQQQQQGVERISSSSAVVLNSTNNVANTASSAFPSNAAHIRSSSEGLPSDGDATPTIGHTTCIPVSSTGGRQLEPPKDRNQLANMRVIRRNLVYAVGLPPSIATEETLRKPEYFGQYGKIAKIVLNRNHNGNGDPRRASASAYVTFSHKEDTLACILALDGFYLDGRNIRASYGTSKYCSAFIKNVRCNNPDCTYLHGMGDADDTFTKQEIQAGYVTSGRDVQARQQQQLAQHNSSRRKVGSGGPSGTGKVSSSPVFPPPCFDEPSKPERRSASDFNVSHSSLARSASLGQTPAGFSSVAAAAASGTSSSKQIRSNSTTTTSHVRSNSQPRGAAARKHNSNTISSSTSATTAASVVAGGSTPTITTTTQTNLTPLTPLKRGSSAPVKERSSSKTVHNSPTVTTISSASANNSRSVTPTTIDSSTVSYDDMQFLQNMPVPHGLSEQQRNILLEQRRDAVAQLAKQQRNDAGLGLSVLQSSAPTPATNTENVGGTISAIGATSTKTNNAKNTAPGKMPAGDGFIGGSILLGSAPQKPAANADCGVIGGLSLSSNACLPGLSHDNIMNGNNPSLGFGTIGPVPNMPSSATGLGYDDFLSSNNNSEVLPLGNRPFGHDGLRNNAQPPKDKSFNNQRHGSYRKDDKWNSTENSSAPSTSFDNNTLFGGGSLNISGDGIWGSSPPTNLEHSIVPGTNVIQPKTDMNVHVNGFLSNSDRAPGSFSRSSNFAPSPSPDLKNIHSNTAPIGGGVILGKDPFSNDQSGSSTLASMLGIDLPTGSGTLRESVLNVNHPSYLFSNSSTSGNFPTQSNARQDTLWNMNNAPIENPANPLRNNNVFPRPVSHQQGVIGSNYNRPAYSNNTPIGGVTIAGGRNNYNTGASSNNDIALLQSLLPGVHITSGWGANNPATYSQTHNPVIGRNPSDSMNNANNNNISNNGNTWGNFSGLHGNNNRNQNQGMSSQTSIW